MSLTLSCEQYNPSNKMCFTCITKNLKPCTRRAPLWEELERGEAEQGMSSLLRIFMIFSIADDEEKSNFVGILATVQHGSRHRPK